MPPAVPPAEPHPSTLLESVLGMFIDQVREGHAVPLTEDGDLVAMIVSPEVAQAGLRALGRES